MKNFMNNIPLFKVFMSSTAKDEVCKVLDSGFIGQGPKVEEFEASLKSFFKNDKLVTLNSGTAGLHLAIHLLKNPYEYHTLEEYGSTVEKWPGIQDGDEILATALTCTASNWPILANNLKIKWVDIDPTTLNMDLDDLERKITSKTKAIMLVHWGGYPSDLDRIKKIQTKAFQLYGFKPAVIEDGAHSFGSKYKGSNLGSHGNMVMYSLQAIKHVTAVDGGILTLPNSDLYKRAKLIRWYGIDRDSNRKDFRCEDNIPEWGFKFHMNDVNAVVGNENLKHANDIVSKHQSNAKFYDDNLKNIPGLTTLTRHDDRESAFWIYSMLVDNRDRFMDHMKNCGIIVSQVHERNDKHTCVREFRTPLPALDRTIGKVVSIPVGWWITEEDRQYIVDCIKQGW
jgi:dTDP-4-amino-4,6-dideoxygalactose transaminase